jgi:multidrug resistance efflux pump
VVTQVWVANNREVEAGQPLFEIDPSQYRIALDKAQSELDNARRQVDAGSASVQAARANLRAALANELKAEQDATRLERLHREDPGTISVRRLEISRASLDQARAQVTAAEADIQRAIEQKGGNDDANNAILKSALSAVEKARLDLSNTVVKASSRGVITDLRADVGQYAGTGSPVMTLVAIHDVWINADFTENNLGHIHPGSPVKILFDVLPGQVFDGEVRSVGLGVSAGQAPPPGSLPTVQNDRDWLRQSQRFPVVIGFDVGQDPVLRKQLRVGGQASVMAFGEGSGLLAPLGRTYIRLMSWLSYAY